MTGKLTNIARMLRQRSTKAERVLWRKLRGRQLEGYKFRRQQPMGPYIVDFINFEKGIIIELDGGQHASNRDRDKERQAWLRGEGFQILRFWNNDVFENLEGVLETIRRKLNVPPPLTPPTRGGEISIEIACDIEHLASSIQHRVDQKENLRIPTD